MSSYELVYYCDARPEIGFGHLRRALDILSVLPTEWRVAISGDLSQCAKDVAAGAARAPAIVDAAPLPSKVAVYDTMDDPEEPGELDKDRLAAIREVSETLVLISSAHDITLPVSVDVFIDHLPDVVFRGVTPARHLSGLEYAPVHPRFFETPPQDPLASTSLLAIIGGSADQVGPRFFCDSVLPRLGGHYEDATLIVSPYYPASDRDLLMQEFPQVRVLQGVPSVVPHMAAARAVVTTYGNATFESIALERPTFTLNYKGFQSEYAALLERQGWIVNLGLFSQLDEDKCSDLASDDVLRRLHKAVKNLIPAPGIEAISNVLREELSRVPVA